MDGAKNINLMMKMEEKLTPKKIKTWSYRTVSGCLEARVGRNKVHLRISDPIRDTMFLKGKITVVRWRLLLVGRKCKPWVISPDVMQPSGYVRQSLLNKERFHLWDFLPHVWINTDKELLVSLWRYLSSYPPGKP